MSPWLLLSSTSILLAIPLIFAVRRLESSERLHLLDHQVRRWTEGLQFYGIALGLLAWLYRTSLSEWASFDEYSYSMGTRDPRLFVGANHFLSHYVAHIVYKVFRHWSDQTLLLRQYLNIGYSLLSVVLVRQILLLRGQDRSIAQLGSLLLGVTFGFWKFSVSAEVYPLMLLFWLAALWQGHRILSGSDSWRNFWLLSLFANLAVLAHDMAALMGAAFLIAFLLTPGEARARHVIRYVTTGLVLLFLFQGYVYMVSHTTSFTEFLDRHLLYIRHPDTTPGEYHYSILSNSILSVREALYSMFTGIDSQWRHYTAPDRVMTFATHAAVASCLGLLYLSAGAGYLHVLRNEPGLRATYVLPLLNLFMIYAFSLIWRPNDEIQHWFLPFVITGCFVSSASLRPGSHLMLSAAILFVSLCASGIYSPSSGKLLTAERRMSLLNDIPDSPDYAFSTTQNVIGIRYYRRHVTYTSDAATQRLFIQQGKKVFVHTGDFDHFDTARYEFIPPPPFPGFYQVVLKSTRGKRP